MERTSVPPSNDKRMKDFSALKKRSLDLEEKLWRVAEAARSYIVIDHSGIRSLAYKEIEEALSDLAAVCGD